MSDNKGKSKSDYDSDEKCLADLGYKDDFCTNDAKFKDGRCGFHTDENEFRNRMEHGLTLSRSDYYEEMSDKDRKWIDAVAYDLLEKSYFEEDDIAMLEKCRQIAVDLHQKRRADGYIAREGLTQENTVGVHEVYGELTETVENTLFITKDRLSRESRLAMKDLGILDDDGGESVDTETVLEKLASGSE